MTLKQIADQKEGEVFEFFCHTLVSSGINCNLAYLLVEEYYRIYSENERLNKIISSYLGEA